MVTTKPTRRIFLQPTTSIEQATWRVLELAKELIRLQPGKDDPLWAEFEHAREDLATWATWTGKDRIR